MCRLWWGNSQEMVRHLGGSKWRESSSHRGLEGLVGSTCYRPRQTCLPTWGWNSQPWDEHLHVLPTEPTRCPQMICHVNPLAVTHHDSFQSWTGANFILFSSCVLVFIARLCCLIISKQRGWNVLIRLCRIYLESLEEMLVKRDSWVRLKNFPSGANVPWASCYTLVPIWMKKHFTF